MIGSSGRIVWQKGYDQLLSLLENYDFNNKKLHFLIAGEGSLRKTLISDLKDKGKQIIKEAAMAKLFSSEMCMKVTTEAIQIFGGYGYIKEYDVERFFRDSKILEIGEGTSEVQRIIISREILNNINSI